MKRTYYALTTTNAQLSGWTILAVEPSRQEAETAGLAELDRHNPSGPAGDIYSQTEHRNFVVLSRTAAIRGRYIPARDSDAYYDQVYEREQES